MPTQLQLRRGTRAQNDSFTGAAGELSIDTDGNNIRVHDGSTAGGIPQMPTGTILAFGGSTIPDGYLLCDGPAISRTTFAALFAIIGTAFGAGDGSSTFNEPDLRDRVPLGKGTNNDTLGAQNGSIPASATVTTGSASAVVSSTNTTVAATAKDSSTTTVVASVTVPSHTHDFTFASSVVNYIIKT